MFYKKSKKISSIFLTIYITLSLPITTVFYSNEYYRFIYFEIVNSWKAKFTPPITYFVEIVLQQEDVIGASD